MISDGTARCWGRNDLGQLGDNSQTNRTAPVTVSGLTGVSVLAAGTYHSCAVLTSGAMKCWGRNNSRELGDGTTANPRLTPVSVVGVNNAISVATGMAHTCALLSTGQIQCWGANSDGQLGNGTTTGSSYPVYVAGIADAVSITAGQYHTCAKTVSGAAKCWGKYNFGQLGNGMSGDSAAKISTPADVIGLGSGVASLTASSSGGSTCAILTDGSIQCWGYNGSGQLGTGDQLMRTQPTAVTGLTGAALTMTIGGSFACANMPTTGAMCWGGNNVGQHGAGNTSAVNYPQHVVGF